MGVSDLESIHNTIHGYVGGNMGQVPLAAFDPVFWLHHANVDRILVLWQERFPDVWVQVSSAPPVMSPASRARAVGKALEYAGVEATCATLAVPHASVQGAYESNGNYYFDPDNVGGDSELAPFW